MSTKAEMKAVLQRIIDRGRKNAILVMEKIQNEVPQDRIVKATALNFEADESGIFFRVPESVERERLHRNAWGQVMERAGIPGEYARELATRNQPDDAWGNELLAHNLRTVFAHQKTTKYLTRSYASEMRALLSNKFRRLDSRPIVDNIAKACQAVGALPTDGIFNDTRVSIQILLPTIYEPIPGEFMCLGYSWQNSDFGNGAHTLKEYILRVKCANGMTGEETLRQVHLGGRLEDEEIWSSRTYKLDTDRSASMVHDAIKGYLSPHKIQERMNLIKAAHDKEVEPKSMQEFLKKQLGAGKAKEVIDCYNGADVENLPPGNSMWRMANALTWLAGKESDADKRFDMMSVAYDVTKKAA